MQLLKKQRWFSFLSASVLALSLVLTGCGPQATGGDTQKSQHEGTWKITTTTGMVADIVAKVGGNQVEVTQLMGAGVDPHLYKASQGDIKRIEDADIVFYSGLHLEGKMVDIFEQMSKKKPVIAVTKQIPKELLHADPESPDQPDPHVWFDVSLWMKAVEQVRDSLSEIDTLHKDMYHTNATNYLKQLQELHDYAKEQVATVPKEQRVLVTAHDAFAYFGKAYDIEVVGLQGISTASEYGLKDVQNLVTTLVDRKIKAVFVESSVPKRSIEAVVEGASAKNHNVVIGGELFSDAMGTPGTPEGNYIGMVKHNVDTIVSALK
ncbi:metal ABC transporter solute-binding protein, Zn/Mn family [Brevibacillus laterosporus]|uniref:metal ABC transporter solute-binding protein, Zn/Mn family n=1 Tax=Brevibacillus laterosporus TaxID=1465 RepID=UPI00265433E1|nr:zinc ABC transporter substrate-binding protein [Brevibacillus laterosporus]MDN9010904.1 zinc ABC transporter substrate-binding protein [Brevibacillus laterosporus]MDO0941927.1 zinc ABC transporter substrate-binding protein [Brevibacillus laterosporus]